MGWLRTTLAQRHVDNYRSTRHEAPLDALDPPAQSATDTPSLAITQRLQGSVEDVLRGLSPEDRFLLSSYFLDQHTLREIAELLRVHEATVSRKLKRLTADLRKHLLKSLQTAGLSKRAAEEALGTDPRDLTINLRDVLQTPPTRPFSDKASSLDQTP
jgi:RNA polymerase sigma-70 factor (ECF subfamily)